MEFLYILAWIFAPISLILIIIRVVFHIWYNSDLDSAKLERLKDKYNGVQLVPLHGITKWIFLFIISAAYIIYYGGI